MKGKDLHAEITISFEDAAFGCDKQITISRSIRQTAADFVGAYSGRNR